MAWGIGGWLLTPFLQKAGPARVAQFRDQVAAGLTTTFASSYTAQVSLPGALSLEAIAGYGRQVRVLPITSSRMGCLLDSLDRGYRVLGI